MFPQIVEEVRYIYSLLSIRNLALHKMDSVGNFLTTEIGVNLVLISWELSEITHQPVPSPHYTNWGCCNATMPD